MAWFMEAHLETADLRRGERAQAFIAAVSRLAGAEIANANLVPIRGSAKISAERAALMEAAEAFEAMRPALVAKLPPT